MWHWHPAWATRRLISRIRVLYDHLIAGWYLWGCTDYDLVMEDWPRLGITAGAHFTCRTFLCFDHGSGKGRTAREAARRAIKNMRTSHRKRVERADPDDIGF